MCSSILHQTRTKMKCNIIYAILLVLIGAGFLLITNTDLHSLALSVLSFSVLAIPLLTLITQRKNKNTSDNDVFLGL
jgi:hypothetical protein